ncbi:NlpC/P60 family protein [Gordonia sp. ABSL49_1]|uniref:NlpC/P60 family protein n=2 Tax=unclassified Gordonia (in: high G+C Gram-positive bacteria) TaxID=2657482 RepID=UPI001F0D694F|nr:NlpC/P60 family protein [Gordonia sp. ABSL49_1]MCH5643464.1 NlpC/P60 family protein [Gordonia sp. ABSL49_1]
MTRGTTGAGHRASWPARLGALMAAGLLGVVGVGGAMGAPGASRPASPVSGLINQLAQVNQNIADLDDALAVRQEFVNRSLVDYQNSVAAQRLATVAAQGAQRALRDSGRAVVAAQREFDHFVRQAYRQGGEQGSMANYASSPDPQSILDRMTLLDQISEQHQGTIRRLQVARNQQANRVAAAEATKRQAAFAATSAAQRRTDALGAFNQARSALSTERQRRTTLIQQRDNTQARLDRLRGVQPRKVAAGPSAAELLSNLFPPMPGRPAGPSATPAAGDNQALAVAAEAAARLALDLGQKALAAIVGQQQLPQSQLLNELGIGGSDMTGSSGNSLIARLGSGSLGSLFGSSSGNGQVRPGLRGPQAVELVVNRALSQLNVPYAWGGGNANGPTQGIRDGGVADSFGDYNKTGFDCSGLMIYAFAGVGIELPHYTGYQYTSGPQVPLSQIRRGDMIFYGPNASQHVALYLGDNKMVEAPQSGDVVKVSPLRTDGAMPNVVRLL